MLLAVLTKTKIDWRVRIKIITIKVEMLGGDKDFKINNI
jgi:hypothetical protein